MLTPNQIIYQRYQIIRLVGQGGFGAVYQALDRNLNVIVALKENFETKESARRQFTHEATILAALKHPNLPRVTDYFTLPAQGQYLVMDYVEGTDLKTLLAQKGAPLPADQAVPWIMQICDALAYMHSQKPPVIHRDLKPENIIITRNHQAMLVDFGVAKVYDSQLKTTAGARAVTPGFSPPEQYGHGTTDARSDIYALGATLYTLLTNQEPIESIQRTLRINLANPRSLNPGLSYSLDHAIMKAMEPVPADRYQQMEHFKAALTRQQNMAPLVKTPPRSAGLVIKKSPAIHSFPRHNPKQIAALGIIAGLVLAGLLVLFAVLRFFQPSASTASNLSPTLTETPLSVNSFSDAQTAQSHATQTGHSALPMVTPVPTHTISAPIPAATLTPPANSPTLPASGGTTCVKLVYLRDVTIPDNSLFAVNTRFIKTWQLQNVGNCPLENGAVLQYISGDRMSASDTVPIPAEIQPGQTFNVSIPMTTPDQAGEYHASWGIRTNDGVFLSALQLSVIIRVY